MKIESKNKPSTPNKFLVAVLLKVQSTFSIIMNYNIDVETTWALP